MESIEERLAWAETLIAATTFAQLEHAGAQAEVTAVGADVPEVGESKEETPRRRAAEPGPAGDVRRSNSSARRPRPCSSRC
jgi:hypothetical protein